MSQIIRKYKKGCDYCRASGVVSSAFPTSNSVTEICPVCNGEKTIEVTEIENNDYFIEINPLKKVL